MGSGKGSPEAWVAVVKPGRVMFELAGVPEALAREALRLAGTKLPVKTTIVLSIAFETATPRRSGGRPRERSGVGWTVGVSVACVGFALVPAVPVASS